MNIRNFLKVSWVLIALIYLNSCQKDNYPNPEKTTKNYSFTIPSKLNFSFKQQAGNGKSILPYSNNLTLTNISNKTIFGEYVIYAFKDDNKIYNNLSFIKSAHIEGLKANESIDSVQLLPTDILFSDNNLIASIINFKDSLNDHKFNGIYTGELNILKPIENKKPSFIRSITCNGFIDFQGKFNFYTQDSEESNIVSFTGNFNTDDLITGHIKKEDNTILSQLTNIDSLTNTQLSENKLTGHFKFNENSEERILKITLTRQN